MGLSRYAKTALVLIMSLALAAGCAPTDPQNGFDAEPTSLTLAVSRECLSANVFIAQESGAFAAEGLDVTIVEYPSSQPCMEALVAGEVDAATCADTPIVFAALDGARFDVLATIASSDNDIKVVVRADRGIDDPRELEGACIATAPGTAAHAFLATFLSRHGIASEDVDLCLEPFDAVADGLASGRLGAGALREPFVAELVESLGSEVLVFEEPGLYLKTMNVCVAPDLDASVRIRLMRALVAFEPGADAEVCDEAVPIVAERLGLDPEEACDSLCAGEYRIRIDQGLLLALEDQVRWATASGLTEAEHMPDFLDYFDMDPLDAVDPSRVEVIR